MAVGEMIQDDDLCLITAAELAGLLKLSTRNVWRLRSAGKMPQPIRLGGVVRWRLGEVKKWIAAGCPPVQSRENEWRGK